MSVALIKFDNVSKSFSLGDGSSLKVLNDLSFEVNSGETVAIMGPSGCGKSTLLNILGILDFIDSGDAEIDGVSVTSGNADDFAEKRMDIIGFVFQKHHLLPQLTALENVLLPTLKSKENYLEKAKSLLEKVGLSERFDHRPGQMSGGECQRVALCRALINSPKILLADEPTGALDAKSAEQLSHLLLQLNKEEGLTIISVTHSADFAAKMAKTYHLIEGTLKEG